MKQREIKFRAWDKKEKDIFQIEELLFDKSGEVFCVKRRGFTSSLGVYTYPKKGNVVLMQFTGLLDKDGKEIYEGDVLLLRKPRNSFHPTNQRVLVEYRVGERFPDGTLQYEGVTGFYFKSLTQGLSTVFTEDEVRIIGNVFENPNLLKQKK